MLIAFFGPTGAGKSKIIEELRTMGVLQTIEVWTTRPPRSPDPGKRSISDVEYTRLEEAGVLMWSNTVHGYRYGTPKEAIQEAIKSPKPSHAMDFSIENAHKIEALNSHRAGVLLLPSKDILRSRLMNSNRSERLGELDEQYDRYIEYRRQKGWRVIDDRVVRDVEFAKVLTHVLLILSELR